MWTFEQRADPTGIWRRSERTAVQRFGDESVHGVFTHSEAR